MSNKNHPNNDYRSIDILDLSVDDWFTPFSELVKRQSTNQAKDQEAADNLEPERPNQGRRPEVEPVQETTATTRQTKERVVAKVALTGQSVEERGSVKPSQTGQDEPRAEVAKPQDTDPKESPAERLAHNSAWQDQGSKASEEVRARIFEQVSGLYGFSVYGDYLRNDNKSELDINRYRQKALDNADAGRDLVVQLYANPGWTPDELLQRELLQRDIEESPDNIKLVETLDAVHDLFDAGNSDDDIDAAQSNAIVWLATYNLDELGGNILVNNAADSTRYFSCVEHADSGCVGVITLYHLRKKLQDDEPIKKILRIADSSSLEAWSIAKDMGESGDVADYERKLGLIDRMVEQVDRYFDGAEAKENFTIRDLGVSREGNMLYRWIIARSAEHRVAKLSEDELRQNTEKYADSEKVYYYTVNKWDGSMHDMVDTIKNRDAGGRKCRTGHN